MAVLLKQYIYINFNTFLHTMDEIYVNFRMLYDCYVTVHTFLFRYSFNLKVQK